MNRYYQNMLAVAFSEEAWLSPDPEPYSKQTGYCVLCDAPIYAHERTDFQDTTGLFCPICVEELERMILNMNKVKGFNDAIAIIAEGVVSENEPEVNAALVDALSHLVYVLETAMEEQKSTEGKCCNPFIKEENKNEFIR